MPADPYTIRSARPEDLAILPLIEQAAAAQFRTTSYPVMADAALASAAPELDCEDIWVVVDPADQPVGFAIVHWSETAVHLHELDVHPRYARLGLGRRLIATISDRARNQGVRALTLTTFDDVPWNGPYYVRLGFRTLREDALSPSLWAVRQSEEAAGLPIAHRICMQLEL